MAIEELKNYLKNEVEICKTLEEAHKNKNDVDLWVQEHYRRQAFEEVLRKLEGA